VHGGPHTHVVNTLGQRFDIKQMGEHTLLAVPLDDTHRSRPLLLLRAVLVPSHDAHPCDGAVLVKRLHVAGDWLSPLKSLEFGTATHDFDTPRTIKLRVNDGRILSAREFASVVPPDMVTAARFHPHPSPGQRVDTLVVTIRLGPLTVRVGFAHVDNKANWLWVEADGLHDTWEEIGGLMGQADGSEAREVDRQCADAAAVVDDDMRFAPV